MTQEIPLPTAEHTSVFAAIRRYWWVVLPIAGLFIALGFLTASSQEEKFRASAEIIITDSRATQPFTVTDLGDPSSQPSDRFLADQVEILRSSEVARRASQILIGDFDTRAVLKRRTVEGDLNSNLIVITFEAAAADDAKRGADAIATAYESIQSTRLQATASRALAELDQLLDTADQTLADIQEQIDAIEAGDSGRQQLVRQVESAGVTLTTLRLRRDAAALDTDERTALNTQIDELARDLAVLELILRVETPTRGLASLLAELDAVVAQRSSLLARRDAIVADLEIAGPGITLLAPALLPEEPTGLGLQLVLTAFTAVGLALGAAVAYTFNLRRRDFSEKSEPEALLEAPMIGEIPSFQEDGVTSSLPVKSKPSSRSAEAFRFIAEAISTQQDRAKAAGEDAAAIVGVAGASTDDGAGIVAANVAAAYAEQGRRVLIIDADFQHRSATRALAPDRAPVAGLSELLLDGISPMTAVIRVFEERRFGVDLVGQGRSNESAPMIFNDERLPGLVSSLADGYDLTIVACPPLLEIAYSTRVLDLTDAALAVVGHGASVSSARDFRNQISMVGAPVVGYVYNRSGS